MTKLKGDDNIDLIDEVVRERERFRDAREDLFLRVLAVVMIGVLLLLVALLSGCSDSQIQFFFGCPGGQR